MDDKELEIQEEDHFDPEELDFTLDGEEDEGDAEAEPEERKDEPVVPVEDERISRLEAEVAAARADAQQASKDREEAWEEAEKARTTTIHGAIQQWNNDLAREQREMLVIQQQYERAKLEQDGDKVEALIAKYSEKQTAVNQLNGNLNNAQQQLNNKPVRKAAEVTPEKKRTAGELMADKWAAENSWYNDPAHMAKRKIVDETCKKAIEAKYDPGTLKFWQYVDKEVEAATNKKDAPRRTPPAFRPVSSNQTGTQTMSGKKKADAEILTAAHRMLERRGISKSDPRFDKLQKSYYATVKREVEKAKQNG